MHFLQRAGIRVAIVTGRVSESVRLRARELGVDDVAQDPDGAQARRPSCAFSSAHGIAPSRGGVRRRRLSRPRRCCASSASRSPSATPSRRSRASARVQLDAQRRPRRGARVRRAAAQGARRMGATSWSEYVARAVAHLARGRPRDTPTEIVERGRRVVRLEREALATLEERLGDDVRARRRADRRRRRGRVIVAGVGQVRADRPEDRRDAHVHGHAGDVPPSRSTASTATSGSSGRTTSRSSSRRAASRTSCSRCWSI